MPAMPSAAVSHSARSSGESAAGWLMSWFWQKTHLRLQPAKKMVPEPPRPTSGRSSPKCGPKLATCATAPTPQEPNSPAVRSGRQLRGQVTQRRSMCCAFRARSASSPDAWRAR